MGPGTRLMISFRSLWMKWCRIGSSPGRQVLAIAMPGHQFASLIRHVAMDDSFVPLLIAYLYLAARPISLGLILTKGRSRPRAEPWNTWEEQKEQKEQKVHQTWETVRSPSKSSTQMR